MRKIMNFKNYYPLAPETGEGPTELINKNIITDGAGPSVADLTEIQAKQALCIYIKEYNNLRKKVCRALELLNLLV